MARVTVTSQDVTKAVREKVKAAIGIDGMSGDGKSGLMLELLYILSGKDWDKVHITDSENRSLSLYVGKKLQSGTTVGQFHHAKMSKHTGYSAFNYEFFREDARKKGCTAAGMDSSTHMWYREGGVLDQVNKIEANRQGGQYSNKYTAWGHPDIVDAKNLIFDLIRDPDMHVISTIRIKDDYVMTTKDGQTKIENVGLKEIQADGLKYEFDLLLRMVSPANTDTNTPAKCEVLKSRYDLFQKGETISIDTKLIESLAEYLEKGTSREELDEKMRVEMITGLKSVLVKDQTILQVIKGKFPKKLEEYDLKDLRKINSLLLELIN